MKPFGASIEPPRPLGEHGRALWDRIQGEYYVTDSGGVEILLRACLTADLAEALAARIEREGATIGNRAHPAVKDLLQARALVVRTIEKLGITQEPIRAVGSGPHKPSGRRNHAD